MTTPNSHYLPPNCSWASVVLPLLFSQTAHYDKCVINLREQHKPDMSPVLEYIFSHAQVSKKNILVTMLIVRLTILGRAHQSFFVHEFFVMWSDVCLSLCVGPTVWKRSHSGRWADDYSEWTHRAQQDGELKGGFESQTGKDNTHLTLSFSLSTSARCVSSCIKGIVFVLWD